MDEKPGTLDEQNAERLKRIVSQGIPLQPGMFENMRVMCYLEALLTERGILEVAQRQAAEKIGEMLEVIERAANEAKLRTGGFVGTERVEDIAKIYGLPPRG
jgi:uncharacterized hydantoinase/oxoprolinase family protein